MWTTSDAAHLCLSQRRGIGKHFHRNDLNKVQRGERKSTWLRCRDEVMSALLGDSWHVWKLLVSHGSCIVHTCFSVARTFNFACREPCMFSACSGRKSDIRIIWRWSELVIINNLVCVWAVSKIRVWGMSTSKNHTVSCVRTQHVSVFTEMKMKIFGQKNSVFLCYLLAADNFSFFCPPQPNI